MTLSINRGSSDECFNGVVHQGRVGVSDTTLNASAEVLDSESLGMAYVGVGISTSDNTGLNRRNCKLS